MGKRNEMSITKVIRNLYLQTTLNIKKLNEEIQLSVYLIHRCREEKGQANCRI